MGGTSSYRLQRGYPILPYADQDPGVSGAYYMKCVKIYVYERYGQDLGCCHGGAVLASEDATVFPGTEFHLPS